MSKKRFWIFAFVLFLFVASVYVDYRVQNNYKKAVLFSPDDINFSKSCDEADIEQMWEALLFEPYTDITVHPRVDHVGGECVVGAMKYEDLAGYDKITTLAFGRRDNESMAYVMTYELDDPNNNKTLNVSDYQTDESFYFFFGEITNLKNRTTNIDSVGSAWIETQSKIKINASNFSKWNEKYDGFEYRDELLSSNYTDTLFVSKNFSVISLFLERGKNVYPCTPYWQAQNTSCTNDQITTHYEDWRNCDSQEGRPANITYYYDCDSNGVVGDFDDFESSNADLVVYDGDSVANSSNKFNTTRTMKFKEGNQTRVEFSYNFSAPLNMKEIEIKKQPSSSGYGYIIVNGINVSKTVYVDKKMNSSNSVCIKNLEVESISGVSGDCDEDNETKLNCPGSGSGYSCSISGSILNVSGLTHSAVRELGASIEIPSNCTTNWTCVNWTACANSIQTRTCTDRNNCNVTNGRPALNQSCGAAIVPCITNWSCDPWEPEDCPKNETQTTVCVDLNNCGVETGKPTETRTCEYKGSKMLFWILVITGGVLLITMIIVGIIVISKSNSSGSENYYYGLTVSPPGSSSPRLPDTGKPVAPKAEEVKTSPLQPQPTTPPQNQQKQLVQTPPAQVPQRAPQTPRQAVQQAPQRPTQQPIQQYRPNPQMPVQPRPNIPRQPVPPQSASPKQPPAQESDKPRAPPKI